MPPQAYTRTSIPSNFVRNHVISKQKKPAIIRPKAVYPANLFTPEQEEFLKNVAIKTQAAAQAAQIHRPVTTTLNAY